MAYDWSSARAQHFGRRPHAERGRVGAPRIYGRGITVRVFLQIAVILLLIEGIFLAEKLAAIVDESLRKKAFFADFLLLLVYTAPHVANIALPIAALVAFYRVTMQSREDNEFVVLAGAGVGTSRLILLAAMTGVGALLACLLISGAMQPYASFAYRSVVFSAQERVLTKGIPTDKFFTFGDRSVYVVPGQPPQPGHLFIHQAYGDSSRVIVSSDGSERLKMSRDGTMTLQLSKVSIYDFAKVAPGEPRVAQNVSLGAAAVICDGCASSSPMPFVPERNALTSSMSVRNLTQELRSDELLLFRPRGDSAGEWTLPELLGIVRGPEAPNTHHLEVATEKLVRAFMCLIAPVLALLALTFTTRLTYAFALPSACCVLMSFELLASTGAKSLVALGPAAIMIGVCVSSLAAMALLAWLAALRHHGLLQPALAKS